MIALVLQERADVAVAGGRVGAGDAGGAVARAHARPLHRRGARPPGTFLTYNLFYRCLNGTVVVVVHRATRGTWRFSSL